LNQAWGLLKASLCARPAKSAVGDADDSTHRIFDLCADLLQRAADRAVHRIRERMLGPMTGRGLSECHIGRAWGRPPLDSQPIAWIRPTLS